MTDTTEIAPSPRNAKGQFLPGNKPTHGGRPKGARDRHSRNFLEAFANDFEAHGRSVIEEVRTTKPDVYLRIAADRLPRSAELDVEVNVFHQVADVVEAFRVASDLLGTDPQRGLRRIRQIEIDDDTFPRR